MYNFMHNIQLGKQYNFMHDVSEKEIGKQYTTWLRYIIPCTMHYFIFAFLSFVVLESSPFTWPDNLRSCCPHHNSNLGSLTCQEALYHLSTCTCWFNLHFTSVLPMLFFIFVVQWKYFNFTIRDWETWVYRSNKIRYTNNLSSFFNTKSPKSQKQYHSQKLWLVLPEQFCHVSDPSSKWKKWTSLHRLFLLPWISAPAISWQVIN